MNPNTRNCWTPSAELKPNTDREVLAWIADKGTFKAKCMWKSATEWTWFDMAGEPIEVHSWCDMTGLWA